MMTSEQQTPLQRIANGFSRASRRGAQTNKFTLATFEHDPTSTLMNDPSIKLVNRGSNGGGGLPKDSLENNNSSHQNEESNSERAKNRTYQRERVGGRVGEAAATANSETVGTIIAARTVPNYSNNNANYRNGGGTSREYFLQR